MMTHLSDGHLVRLLDGETGPDDRARLEQHLDGCALCMTRLDTLRRDAELVHEALCLWDAGVGRRRRMPLRWWRAAAAIVVLAGLAGVVQPVRAWIADSAGAVWSAIAGGGAAQADRADAVVEDPVSHATVSFELSGERFLVELADVQASGTLSILTEDRADVVAEVVGGTGGENLVVLPAGLRIENSPTSRARYVLHLPRSLSGVQVTVAGESTLGLVPAGAVSRWEIDLRSAGVAPAAGQ